MPRLTRGNRDFARLNLRRHFDRAEDVQEETVRRVAVKHENPSAEVAAFDSEALNPWWLPA